jgi:isoquinoline 1-oxidoreductase beta subunit
LTSLPIDRRSFLVSAAAAGGVLTLGFAAPSSARAHGGAGAPELTAWIVIHPDDRVVVRIARSEMGQGSSTGLAMLVAEELACDWSKVGVEFVEAGENVRRNRIWGDMSTGGSRSIRSSQVMLRKAGATAREMLIAAAAERWGVPAGECRAGRSLISHAPSGRTLAFGAVAAAAASVEPPTSVALKDEKDWTLIGTPQKRLDVPAKVTGKPIYAIDVRLPGMLYAALVQCPVFKGRLKSADDAKIAGMKGVHRVIKLDDAVAVVAESWWLAHKSLEALPIAWDDGGNGKVSSASIRNYLRSGFIAREAGVGRQEGDVYAALGKAKKRITAEYEVPFLAHATLEPQNCTAQVTGDKVEIWVPTQHAETALAVAAAAAGVPRDNVVVHKTMLGGGFGRRGIVQDFIPHAVKIAKAVGRPVQTIWSREEDMRHDYYRPVVMAKMTAGLDAAGLPTAWHIRLSGNSIIRTLFSGGVLGGADTHVQEGFTEDMPYDVPNYLVDYAERNTHVPVGFWRSVSHSQNCFFKECFVDEMAAAAGQDPYLYRRRLIAKHPRAQKFLGVLDAAAKKARWGEPLPAGVFRGIAVEEIDGSFVAGVAEVALTRRRHIKVRRFVCAVDPGHVVNPLAIELQIQSGVVFGLTATLYSEITIKDGRVEQSNFHDYDMLRLADMPKVEALVVPSGGFWGGVGEVPTPVVAPAVCNAIFAATGKRIRSLPLKNHAIHKA